MSEEPTEVPTEEEIKEFEGIKKEAERDFYYAIGSSITTWSKTEGHLVYVAAMLLDTTPEKAGVVFYSIMNFYTWLSVIDELFAIDPKYQPLQSDWNAIAKRLKKLNEVRVRLAHHAVEHGKGIEGLLADGDDELRFFPSLKPNKLDLRNKTQKHSPLQIDEVVEFVRRLVSVIEAISELIGRMNPIQLKERKDLLETLRSLVQSKKSQQAKEEP
jgi:DNA repair exonuclease SbcCD ATPase subunit